MKTKDALHLHIQEFGHYIQEARAPLATSPCDGTYPDKPTKDAVPKRSSNPYRGVRDLSNWYRGSLFL